MSSYSYWRAQAKLTLCLLGVMISCYAVYVEVSKDLDPSYAAMCDFSEGSSCSRVLTSSYSVGMGWVGSILGEDSPLNVSNSFYGIIVYSLIALLSFFPTLDRTVVPVLVFIMTAASLYLLYVMLYVLEDMCVVCCGIHVINMSLFCLTFYSCMGTARPRQDEWRKTK